MDHQLLIAATNALSCIMIYKYLDLLPSYFPPFQHHSLPSCVLSATLADVLFVATIFSRMSPFLYPSLLHAPVIRTWSERLLILKFASSLTSFVTISMAFGCVKEDFHRHHESLTSLRSRYAVSIYIWKFWPCRSFVASRPDSKIILGHSCLYSHVFLGVTSSAV